MQYPSTPQHAADRKDEHKDAAQLLRFVRHGATAINLAGLRCGGDIDPPLAEAGRQQAWQTGQHLAALARQGPGPGPGPGLIVTSDLQRTRETATILAAALGGLPVQVLPGWAERHLGQWNLLPVADTEAALLAGLTPPCGESEAAFSQRIRQAVQGLLPLLHRRPLLVGSKGVARMLGQLCGLPDRVALDNGALWHFDLAALACPEPVWETS